MKYIQRKVEIGKYYVAADRMISENDI